MTIQTISHRFRLWLPQHRVIASILIVSSLGVIVANATVTMASRVNGHEQLQDRCGEIMKAKSLQLLGSETAAGWKRILEQDPAFAVRALARR